MSSEELKRYTPDWAGRDFIEHASGCWVEYSDYAALEAENARLREERDSFQRVGIQAAEERDAARAQLAAIQGGMGEVVEVVVVAWRCEATKPGIKTQRRIVGTWEEAESFALHYEDRGCKVTTTALVEKKKHQRITAAMAAEVERHKLDALNLKAQRDGALENMRFAQAECDAMRAELEENDGVIAVWRGRLQRAEAELESYRQDPSYDIACKTIRELRAELAAVKGGRK